MLVKICGITRPRMREAAVDAGAERARVRVLAGQPALHRSVPRARDSVARCRRLSPPVGVFVNQPVEYVSGVASLVRLGAVQLHGDETPRVRGAAIDAGHQGGAARPTLGERDRRGLAGDDDAAARRRTTR